MFLKSDQQLKDALGADVEFQKLPKHARIVRYAPCDIRDHDSWPQCFAWLRENGEVFKRVLQDRVKALDLELPGDQVESSST